MHMCVCVKINTYHIWLYVYTWSPALKQIISCKWQICQQLPHLILSKWKLNVFTTNVAQRQEIELLKFRQAQRCPCHVLGKQHLVKSTNRFVWLHRSKAVYEWLRWLYDYVVCTYTMNISIHLPFILQDYITTGRPHVGKWCIVCIQGNCMYSRELLADPLDPSCFTQKWEARAFCWIADI